MTVSRPYDRGEVQLINAIINDELEKLNRWLVANRLAINVSKTKCILFAYRNRYNNLTNVTFRDDVIDETDTLICINFFILYKFLM